MANFYNFLFLNIFLILCLAGCVSLPAPSDSPAVFALKGKVAVREGEAHFSANFRWLQAGDDFEIDLWGPLGQGRVQLVKKNAEIILRDGQNEVLAQGDAETLMRSQLGWSMPVDVLPAWVQGRPLDGVAVSALAYDSDGRVLSFEQLGWQVLLERYQTFADASGDRELPRRVTAVSGSARLRLVISEWQI